MNLAIVLLALSSFASAASLRVTDAMLPRLASEFHVGIDHASSVVTGFAVAYGLMQILFGPLGDRFGKLQVIGWATAAAALASVACFYAPGLEGLLAGRILAGAFCAAIIPLSMAWIGDVVPYQDRQPVIARFLLGQICGLALGAGLGGIAQSTWSFVGRLPSWPHGSPSARCSSSRWRAAIPFRHPRPARASCAAWSRCSIFRGHARSWRLCSWKACWYSARRHSYRRTLHLLRGTELSVAGLALVPYAIGGAVFAIFAGRFVRGLGEVNLARYGSIVLMLGILAVAWSPNLGVTAFGCLIAGLGFYMFHNTLQTNATQMAPTRRGVGVALFASFFFIGQSVGVGVAGLLVARLGTTPVLVAAGVLLVPVGFVFAHLRATRAA